MPARRDTPAAKAAVRWFAENGDVPHLDEAAKVDLCAVHLIGAHGLDDTAAGDEALRAWGDHLGRAATARFDLDASTPNVVFVHDLATGERTAWPITDVLRWLGPRRVAPAPTLPDAAA